MRDATVDEVYSLGLSPQLGYDRWVGVIEEDGEITGHICLSMALGQCFGHDTRYWGKDRTGAAKLWLNARKKARSLGFDAVSVHIPPGDPMREFWIKQGFEPVCELLRGDV